MIYKWNEELKKLFYSDDKETWYPANSKQTIDYLESELAAANLEKQQHRKVVQIAAINDSGFPGNVVVLADDGTMWITNSRYAGSERWKSIPNIPQY